MPATRLRIFVSSVQKEFEPLRQDLKAFLLGDAFLKRFIAEVFLFEDLPAKDQAADHVYLTELDRCDIYLGLFAMITAGKIPTAFHLLSASSIAPQSGIPPVSTTFGVPTSRNGIQK